MARLGHQGPIWGFLERLERYNAARQRRYVGDSRRDTIDVPPEIDWFAWRPVFSHHTGHQSKGDIDERWSLTDLLDAHWLIDLHDEAESRADAKARAAARRGV